MKNPKKNSLATNLCFTVIEIGKALYQYKTGYSFDEIMLAKQQLSEDEYSVFILLIHRSVWG